MYRTFSHAFPEKFDPVKKGKTEYVSLFDYLADETVKHIISFLEPSAFALTCRRHEQLVLCSRPDHVFLIAASEGRLGLVKRYMRPGKVNKALQNASTGGHLKTVSFLIKKGALDLDIAFINAAESGHIEMLRLLREKGANSLKAALVAAAKIGQLEAVRLLIEWRAWCPQNAMRAAAEGNHIEVMIYLKEKGASNYHESLLSASKAGSLRAMELLYLWGARNLATSLTHAAMYNQVGALKLLRAWGATNIVQARHTARLRGHEEAVDFLSPHESH
jgi:ankyrin repeat protein